MSATRATEWSDRSTRLLVTGAGVHLPASSMAKRFSVRICSRDGLLLAYLDIWSQHFPHVLPPGPFHTTSPMDCADADGYLFLDRIHLQCGAAALHMDFAGEFLPRVLLRRHSAYSRGTL